MHQAKNIDRFVVDYKKSERQEEEEGDTKAKKYTRMKNINLNDFKEVKAETDKVNKNI